MKYKVIGDKEIPALITSMKDSGITDQRKINGELVLIDDLLSIQKRYSSHANKHELMEMLEKRIEIEVS